MTTPGVSVIVPVLDAGDLLLEALASVARQAAGPIETIVVDDGSSDDPARRLERSPVPVRLLRQERRGPSAARNRGIAAEFAITLDLIAGQLKSLICEQ